MEADQLLFPNVYGCCLRLSFAVGGSINDDHISIDQPMIFKLRLLAERC